jgi:GTPase
VLNKIDRLAPGETGPEMVKRRVLSGVGSPADARTVAISALTGAGIPDLLGAIDAALPLDPIVQVTWRIPAADGATLALLHQFGRVIETHYDGDICRVTAEVPDSVRRRLDPRVSSVENAVGNQDVTS